MRVKVQMSALVTALLPALLFAYPGLGGGRGLFRTQSALVEPEAGLIVSLHSLTRNVGLGTNGRRGWIADLLVPEISYAPVAGKRFGLELFGSWGGILQKPMSATSDELVWRLHDLKAGGKLSVPVIPVLKLGASASYTFISRAAGTGWEVLDPSALPPATGLAWNGLLTLHFQDLAKAVPNVMVNCGRAGSETQYAAAVEFHGDQFCLFVEALSRQPDGKSQGVLDTKNGHVQVTPGITLGTATSAFLKVGYTLSLDNRLNGNRRPNEIVVGGGFGTPLGGHADEYGQIVGTVADAASGAPMAATITFPDYPKLGRMATDTSTGGFRATKVPAGAVTVEASAPGYESRTIPLMVESRRPSVAAIALPRAVAVVKVTGRVTDRKTGKSLAATVRVPEADSAVVTTDAATGIYEAQLLPGLYTLIVESPDYLEQLGTVLVERDKPLARDFQLVSELMVITLQGVYFDFDQAAIKSESRPALEDAAKILIQNPTIRVEIQGHTDSKGSDEYNLGLSGRRAKSVVDYLVHELGMDPSRLTAKGYGESRPVADNATADGRGINRRVDFLILGQDGKTSPDR